MNAAHLGIVVSENPKRTLAWAIAQRVRAAREGQGWTQAELAEKAGIALPSIVRLERGLHISTSTTLEKAARALAIDITNLAAPPEATEEAMREFKAMAEAGIEEWGRELEKEDGR
jgi:transcriptional regulator with XRE-family HTH domain